MQDDIKSTAMQTHIRLYSALNGVETRPTAELHGGCGSLWFLYSFNLECYERTINHDTITALGVECMCATQLMSSI